MRAAAARCLAEVGRDWRANALGAKGMGLEPLTAFALTGVRAVKEKAEVGGDGMPGDSADIVNICWESCA